MVRAPTAPLGTNGAVKVNEGFSLVNGGSPKGVELSGTSSTCLCLALEIPVDLVLLLLLLLLTMRGNCLQVRSLLEQVELVSGSVLKRPSNNVKALSC